MHVVTLHTFPHHANSQYCCDYLTSSSRRSWVRYVRLDILTDAIDSALQNTYQILSPRHSGPREHPSAGTVFCWSEDTLSLGHFCPRASDRSLCQLANSPLFQEHRVAYILGCVCMELYHKERKPFSTWKDDSFLNSERNTQNSEVKANDSCHKRNDSDIHLGMEWTEKTLSPYLCPPSFCPECTVSSLFLRF